jgi:hypothetical protein
MSDRIFLRHTLAALAYRASKTIREAPDNFAEFKIGDQTRKPGRILAHMGDLMDWALSMAKGAELWNDSKPLAWDQEASRFYAALKSFDDYLASGAPLHCEVERLFQGPIADAFTHTGQLAMLRRLAGSPVKAENYFVAEIAIGNVGEKQAKPKREF